MDANDETWAKLIEKKRLEKTHAKLIENPFEKLIENTFEKQIEITADGGQSIRLTM